MNKIAKIGYLLLSLVGFSILITACTNHENQFEVTDNKFSILNLTESQLSLSQNVPSFSERVFKALNRQYPNENVVFSPLSCQWCLGMLANSCEGLAQEQIQEVLGFQDFSIEAINNYNELLSQELKRRDKSITIESANGFFQIPNIASNVKNDFKELLTEAYNAEIITSNKMVPAINDWVKQKTHGQIPGLFDKQEEQRMSVIGMVNALYFNGQWSKPFQKNSTYVGKFQLTDKSSKDVQYMVGSFSATVGDYGIAKSFLLPFGNHSFVMEFILPNEDQDTPNFIHDFQLNYLNRLTYANVNCTIPKFSLNSLYKLEEVLKSLGMTDIFIPGKTDFSPMLMNLENDNLLSVGDIRQGSGFHIDETGVIISSSTSATLEFYESLPQGNYTFTLNRPFIFLIREVCTNAILLMGKIENPQY